MFWNKKKDFKSLFQQYKTLKICGVKFVIRKINPLLDFPTDNIPQIFTDFQSIRPKPETQKQTPEQTKKTLLDIINIIEAGVVEPKLAPMNSKKEEEKGMINASDLLRDFEMGYKLYVEILTHSLNRFKGLKSLFFSMKIKGLLYSEWRKNIKKNQLSFSSLMAIIQ